MKILSLVLTISLFCCNTRCGWVRVGGSKYGKSTSRFRLNTKPTRNCKTRNAALDAEVRDLKQGYDAIEERARSELGMIRQDEIFFHVLEDTTRILHAKLLSLLFSLDCICSLLNPSAINLSAIQSVMLLVEFAIQIALRQALLFIQWADVGNS